MCPFSPATSSFSNLLGSNLNPPNALNRSSFFCNHSAARIADNSIAVDGHLRAPRVRSSRNAAELHRRANFYETLDAKPRGQRFVFDWDHRTPRRAAATHYACYTLEHVHLTVNHDSHAMFL